MMSSIPAIEKFVVTGENLAERWVKYKAAFQYYAAAVDIKEDKRLRDFLLHTGGYELQNVYETFRFGEDSTGHVVDPTYKEVLQKFDEHFNPKRNVTYERHVFRTTAQQPGETIDSFITRLKQAALYCEYHDKIDEHIRDQFVEKCSSANLKRRLLREVDLTLDSMLSIARAHELSDCRHAKKMTYDNKENSIDEGISESVHEVTSRASTSRPKTEPTRSTSRNFLCFRCGRPGHIGRNCNAVKGRRCNYCNKEGHLEDCCYAKQKSEMPKQRSSNPARRKLYQIQCMPDDDSSAEEVEEEYIFAVGNPYTVDAAVNNRTVRFVVDSGATVNVLSFREFQKVKQDSDGLSETNAKVFAYGNDVPLQLKGRCILPLIVAGVKNEVDFVVVQGDFPALLGKKTSEVMGLIKFPKQNKVHTLTGESQLSVILNEYQNLFKGLGKLKNFQASIQVDPQVKPVVQPMRRVPFHVRGKVEAEIERLLSMDVIERVQGPTPWLTPIVAVPKRGGEVRLCLDMRLPNTAIISHKFPIPLVEDILQELEGAEQFTELDFNMGFHQLELEPGSREITTFATETGVYRFKRLNFGTMTAPEIFQQTVKQVLQGCEGVQNFSDNIIVYGKRGEQHDNRLRAVLQRLKDNNLTLNKAKCQFAMEKIPFMGYVVTSKGITLGEDKITAIRDARNPQNVSELKSFLGLVNFCSRFIPNVAQLTAPLRQLLRKQTVWQWDDEQEESFQKIKTAIISETLLTYFSIDKPTELVVDAGPEGIGAVLTQKQENGQFQPIAFASKVLTEREKKYSQTEKEALAVLWGCEKFHMHLMGTEFTIITDHRPLMVIYSPKSRPSARLERWALRLQQYKYRIRYEKGINNIADSLSRLTQKSMDNKQSDLECVAEEYIKFLAEGATPKAVTLTDIREKTLTDETMKQVLKSLQTGKWPPELKEFSRISNELSEIDGILMRGPRIVIPDSLQDNILAIAHESHIGIVRMKALLRTKVWWPKMDTLIERQVKHCLQCQIQGRPEPQEPLTMTTWNEEPWSNVAIDICGPFPQGEYVIVLVDYASKWPEAKIIRSITTSTIIDWLEEVFARFGYPDTVTADNGTQFVSKEFKDYLKHRGIKLRNVTPYWPQANGQVERLNRIFLKSLRAGVCEDKPLRKALLDFLRMYRIIPHCSTAMPPSLVLMGRYLKTKLPDATSRGTVEPVDHTVVKEKAHENDVLRKLQSKRYADCRQHAKLSSIVPGDQVLVKQIRHNKLMSPFTTSPSVVIEKNGNSLLLRNQEGKCFRRTITHVKRYLQPLKTTLVREGDEEDYDDLDDIPIKGAREHGEADKQSFGTSIGNRPKRNIRRPVYLKDYVN